MKKALLLSALLVLGFVPMLAAQPASLNYGEDYTVGDEIHSVTTVRVAPNRIDQYLAGIKQSWVAAMELSEEMGLSKGHAIFVSELPNSGDFNIMLDVVYENAAQREKARDPKVATEFRQRMEQKLSEQKSFELTEGYADIRKITGDYLLREVKLK